MSLTQLAGKLDLGGPADALLGAIGGVTVDLQATTAPGAGDASLEVSVDTSSLTRSVEEAVSAAVSATTDLPDPAATIEALREGIELVSGGAGTDLPDQIRELIARLEADLGRSEGGFLEVLARLGDTANASEELQGIVDLVQGALAGAGLELQLPSLTGEILPGVQGTVRAVGAAMALESTLAEGERLSRILQTQLDADRMGAELAALRNGFEVGSFSLDRLEAEGLAAVDDARAAVRAFRVRLGGVAEQLARGMGFGEATLVHLDPGLLVARVLEQEAVLRGIDVNAVGRGIRSLTDRFQPLFDLDLVSAPADGLDAVFSLVEEHVGDIAAAIDSAELERLAEPVADGIEALTGPLSDVSALVEETTGAARAALEQIRLAVAALPLEEVAGAVDRVLGPVREAMEAATALVGDVQDALETVAGAVTGSLEDAEAAIDAFRDQVDAALTDAADFVEGLGLEEKVGQVSDGVRAFADALGALEMKPYFDTAVTTIDTTADVIDAVPLELLPADMKAELDEAVAPLRAIDVPATLEEVESWFAITPEGRFALEAPLEEAVADIQAQVDEVVAAVAEMDPRLLVESIDAAVAELREQVEGLVPDLTLAPVQEVVDQVKGMLETLDLRAQLQPVQDAFDEVLAVVDEYDPSRLIEDLETEVDEARTRLEEALVLDRWEPTLDGIREQVVTLLDRADPARLEPLLETVHQELLREIDRLDTYRPWTALGDLVAALLDGSGLPARGWTLRSVGRWLGGESGAEDLARRTRAVADALAATRDAVRQFDLTALQRDLDARIAEFRSIAEGLPAGPEREALLGDLVEIRIGSTLGSLEANRTRYLGALESAATAADTLARTGLSQVDETLRNLVSAFEPAMAVRDVFRRILAMVGIEGLEEGMDEPIRRALEVATPARVAGVLRPVFESIRARLLAVLDAVLAPIRAGIADLRDLIGAFDLTPFREGLAAVHAEVRAQIESLSPMALLDPTLAAFDALRAELAAFDPLAPVRAVVDALEQTAVRVLDKLDGDALMEQPIRIYDEIAAALRAIDLEVLLAPILDRLNALASQIDDGLDGTGAALERLQDALPAPGGGSSISASVSFG